MALLDLFTFHIALILYYEFIVFVDGFQSTPQVQKPHRCRANANRISTNGLAGFGSLLVHDMTKREEDTIEEEQEEEVTNPQSDNNDNNENDTAEPDSLDWQDRVDAFLDRPLFDPDQFDESDNSLLGKFARLVKADYELAETLYVGIIFIVLIIVTQEVLRMQLYGDGYSPFVKGGGGAGGKLF